MQAQYCKFVDHQGNIAYINPLQVRYFISGDATHTIIYFSDGLSIAIAASSDEVHRGLMAKPA